MFNQPQAENTGGQYFKPAEHKDSLVLFHIVTEAGSEFDQMAQKERQYRVVEFSDLDGDCVTYTAKVTHGGIVSKLPANATMILGRIEQVKTSNGYLAWVLSPYTPADAEKAKAWINAGKPTKVDPFAKLAADAADLDITPQMLAQLKRLQMTKDDDDPKF